MPGKSGNCLEETRVFRLNGSFQETGAGMIVDCVCVWGGDESETVQSEQLESGL